MQNAELACAFDTKALTETSAQFAGVASTAAQDLTGDVIEAGAFSPIAVRSNGVPDVLMLRDHDRTQVIGGWTRIVQEGNALRVEGELCLEVAKARETYALLKKGFLSGLSVGFLAGSDGVKWDQRGGKRIIKHATLKECSIVAMPANPDARVTQIKDMEQWFERNGLTDGDVAIAMRGGLEAVIAAHKADDGGDGPDRKPWGDVRYADPGYQDDKVKRYPLDVASRVRSAWNYIHQARNRAFYTAAQLKRIEARIIAAWKEKIDPDGPPAYQERSAPLLDAETFGDVRGLIDELRGQSHAA